jgi:heterodisulfide reductase subunit A
MSDSVVVIGGGIAGVQAALDLAEAGARVVLVERGPSIGGKMAALDKNFPTLDCSVCIEAPKLSEVDEHANIEVLNNAEVVALEGEAGNFKLRIRQKAGFVTDECTRCGECEPVCPIVMPNEFDASMASRKAVYTPFPQAVPGAYVVDIDHCLNEPPNYWPCHRCAEACPPQCIDFGMPLEKTLERDAGSVIVSAGFDTFDASQLGEYGYGTHPDILTAMEFERLITSAGPTGGDIIRPSDGSHPQSILFVLCVGSRDERFFRYCSRFCCMYSIKHAFQAIDHGVKDVKILYMDVRAYGKGFDSFWKRTEEEGAEFIRGRPSRIWPNGKDITVRFEDTSEGATRDQQVDMVVLATAVQAPEGLKQLSETLGLEAGDDGFIQAQETGFGLIGSARPGVYLAGCAGGPKDIPDSVAEAAGAAAAALSHLDERSWPEIEAAEPITDLDEPRVGVFVCHCGSNIAGVVDVPQVVEYARTLPRVVYAQDQRFSCAGNTQAEIVDRIRENNVNRLVIAACSPKTHEGTFRRVCFKAGLNPYLLEMVNLRNQDSWVHKEDRGAATFKALDMVKMGVEKAVRLVPLETSRQPMTQRALVVGGGIAGMAAASNLARQGYETHIVEREPELGGLVRHLDEISPAGISADELLKRLRADVFQAGVRIHAGVEIEHIGGHIGDFYAKLSNGEELKAGAVILAMGARPYDNIEFDGRHLRTITNLDLESMWPDVPGDRVTVVGCVGSRKDGAGCSRYCCESMVAQALRLRRMGKKVRVLYRDIRTFSRNAEEMYEDAARAGVQFIRYQDTPPEEAMRIEKDGSVVVRDQLLGADVRIPTDLLVLAIGLRPPEENVSEQLKVSRSEDGFLLEKHPKLGPAEAGSPGIFLAGAIQGPKDVRESLAQGLATAAKAASLLAKDHIEKEPITAQLELEKCIFCGRCVPVCPFGAIEMLGPVKQGPIEFIEAACQGCGTCAAECNYDAIVMPYFTKEQTMAQIEAALAERPEEKVLVFACNWCSYAGADQAGVEKIQYPSSARIIRSMCSGRIEEDFIGRAFDLGAGAVLVTGCRLTEKGSDCHYINANVHTQKRFSFWQRKFERKGIEPERLQLQWISASEGREFARKVSEMDAIVRKRVGEVVAAS